MTLSAAERRRLRNRALVAEHPDWHGVRHPELIALPPRRFSQLDMLPSVERRRMQTNAARDAHERRAERSRAVVEAHPRWRGILHPDRLVFPEPLPAPTPLLAYRASLRRASRHLQESHELCERIAANADAIHRRRWTWATSPAELAPVSAARFDPPRQRRPQLPQLRLPKRALGRRRLHTRHLLPH